MGWNDEFPRPVEADPTAAPIQPGKPHTVCRASAAPAKTGEWHLVRLERRCTGVVSRCPPSRPGPGQGCRVLFCGLVTHLTLVWDPHPPRPHTLGSRYQ